MKFELIGGRNLSNKIKGNAQLRQRKDRLVTYNFIIALEPVLLHCLQADGAVTH